MVKATGASAGNATRTGFDSMSRQRIQSGTRSAVKNAATAAWWTIHQRSWTRRSLRLKRI